VAMSTAAADDRMLMSDLTTFQGIT
jgi:hypothetical protein